MKVITLLLFITCLCSCYRMPSEDDYNAVPLINHPDLTREKGDAVPQIGY